MQAAAVILSSVLLFACHVGAVTWNLTTITQANLAIQQGIPDTSSTWVPCNYPGICQPYPITLPAQTSWAWCGFQVSKRIQFWLQVQGNGTGANITGLLMRATELKGCATPFPPGISACGIIDGSTCDTVQKCYKENIGMAFSDDVCLVVANNDAKGKAANVTIQIWNFDDHTRNVGTAMAIVILVIFCVAITAYFIVSCSRQWKQPTHRIDDLLELERKLSTIDTDSKAAHDQDTFKAKFQYLKQRFGAIVKRNPPTAAPIS